MVSALSKAFPDFNIFIFLTPCQYATGNEKSVCLSFDGVTNVFTPMQTFKFLLFSPFDSGYVFYLGGDPMYPKYFSKRTQSKFIGYSENQLNSSMFDYYIRKSTYVDFMSSGLISNKVKEQHGIVLLPGSRSEHLAIALPMMLEIVSSNDVTVMLSPFTNSDQFLKLKSNYPHVEFKVLNDAKDLGLYKYALTIPGTNTMQLAYLKVPYMMIFPTHDASVLRLDGLIGILLLTPIFGRLIKRIFLNFAIKKKRFYSLPNIYFNSLVCPELVGKFKIEDAKLKWANFISNPKTYNDCIDYFKQLDEIKDPTDLIVSYLKDHIN